MKMGFLYDAAIKKSMKTVINNYCCSLDGKLNAPKSNLPSKFKKIDSKAASVRMNILINYH